jgi:hypothetical protein
VLDNESVGLVAILYFDETKRILLLVFCVIVVVGSNGRSTYFSSSEDGEAEGFASHVLEQLPNLTYCINDNLRWGKEIVICSWQICVLLSCLVLLCLCCEDGALLVVEAWKRSSTIFSCVQSWFCKKMSYCCCCMKLFVCLFIFS